MNNKLSWISLNFIPSQVTAIQQVCNQHFYYNGILKHSRLRCTRITEDFTSNVSSFSNNVLKNPYFAKLLEFRMYTKKMFCNFHKIFKYLLLPAKMLFNCLTIAYY